MEIKKQIELMFKEKQQTTAVVLPQPPKVVNRTGNAFVCNFDGCGATIKHRRNLVRHWQLHQKAKYYCYICGFQSMNREQITQHHCDPNLPKFDCDECEKKKEFTVLQHLNRHLLLIHGIRLFVWCSSCRSYFARIDALKKHQSRCHQSDNIGNSLLSSTNRNNEPVRSMSLPSIPAATITSVSKSKNIITNDNDRIINSVISHQQNGQLISAPNPRRDENHHFITGSSNKQSSIINLNNNALNHQSTSNGNGQNNIDENLFRAQNALINKAPILALDNSGIVGNAFANNLTLVRNSVISSSRGYINTSVSNERDNLHNQFDTMREDYLYRNKKIRFGELMEKDRVFKQ